VTVTVKQSRTTSPQLRHGRQAGVRRDLWAGGLGQITCPQETRLRS